MPGPTRCSATRAPLVDDRQDRWRVSIQVCDLFCKTTAPRGRGLRIRDNAVPGRRPDTTMEGWLGEPAGNLAFAGEHTDSFHNFQGFIEGAAQSGIRAAEYLLDRSRSGLL